LFYFWGGKFPVFLSSELFEEMMGAQESGAAREELL